MIANPDRKSRSADPIGVFDSGVGGLSVLRALRRALPGERFVFVADQAHVPYGGKTGAQLEHLTARVARFLVARHCKLIVVACNTATVYAIAVLRRRFGVPFVGTEPAVKPAAALTGRGVIGVIATPATAASPALVRLIRRHARTIRVIRRGCPGLEELVERGGTGGPEVAALLQKHLAPLKRAGCDVVVLGCTHYPFLARTIGRLSGARTVDSGAAIARRTRALLNEAGLRAPGRRGTAVFFTTGDPARFSRVASDLLRRRIRAERAEI